MKVTLLAFLALLITCSAGIMNENAPVKVWFCSFDHNKEMITKIIIEKTLFLSRGEEMWAYCLSLIKEDAATQHREFIYVAVKDTNNTPIALWKIPSRLIRR